MAKLSAQRQHMQSSLVLSWLQQGKRPTVIVGFCIANTFPQKNEMKRNLVVNDSNDAGKGAVVTVTFCLAALTEHTAQGHHWLVVGLEFAAR